MKDIIGYEGLYAVTSCGKVWSYHSKKFLKPGKNMCGYLQVSLSKNGKVKKFLIHDLVVETYIGKPNDLSLIYHKDGNKEHNYINNLAWKENVKKKKIFEKIQQLNEKGIEIF